MKVLVIGKNGQVGWELQRSLVPLGQVVAVDRTQLDLAEPDSIRQVLRALEPDVVFNAAAYTAVDKAESERDLAMAVNGRAPGILAEESARLGALLVHYSTDYVFDGEKAAPYLEDDPPRPLNVYGETKLAGERAVQAAAGRYIILRTSWVYGLRGKNFLQTILRLARERDELKIVDDQIGAPTWSHAIAEASCRIVRKRWARTPHEERALNGVFHLTASGRTSWLGFARAIIVQTSDRRDREPSLVPITSSEFGALAKRPINSVLSNEKLRASFGLVLNSWDEDLRRVLASAQPA